MTREEFDSLDIHSQVKVANEKLLKDSSLTIKKLRDEILNIPKTTWGDRLRKYNYKYDPNTRQYILNTNVIHANVLEKSQHIEIKKVTEDKNPFYNKSNINVIQIDDVTKNDLLELVNIKTDLIKIVEEYKRNTNIIEVPELKIDNSKLTGEVKLTTIRVYSDIMEKFKDFSESYKEYSKQDLYSMALFEFMEKYKK